MKSWVEFFSRLHKRAASANVIIEDTHGRLLILKAHYKPYWSLPGGWIEESNTPREAAIREVLEEIGLELDATMLEFAGVIDRMSDLSDTYLFVFRLIEPVEASLTLQLQAEEIAEYDWVSPWDIRDGKHGDYSTAVKNWAAERPLTYIEHLL